MHRLPGLCQYFNINRIEIFRSMTRVAKCMPFTKDTTKSIKSNPLAEILFIVANEIFYEAVKKNETRRDPKSV